MASQTLFALVCSAFFCIGVLSGCTLDTHELSEIPHLRESPVCHGQDILGLARQDYKTIAKNWEPGECLGVLAGTFGSSIPPVKAIVEQSTVPAVRWHLSFCNHGAACEPGECLPTDLGCMRAKATAINAFHATHLRTQCYISPRLEYQETDCNRVQTWFDAIRPVAPLCSFVASPLPGSCVPHGVLRESHGNTPALSDVVSNDGSNYFDADVTKFNDQARVLNLKWTPRDNLRLSSEKGTPLPPRKRSILNRLGTQDLRQMQLMKRPVGPMPVPQFCRNFHALSNGEIWKNHAEDYGAKNDARGNKPLLIYSRRVSRMDIFDARGQKIACLKYYGPFGKLYRHYVGSCSGDHAVDLYRKGGEWIYAKDGNTCIPLPSIRRSGSFR